jgi:hypothetical protein
MKSETMSSHKSDEAKRPRKSVTVEEKIEKLLKEQSVDSHVLLVVGF